MGAITLRISQQDAPDIAQMRKGILVHKAVLMQIHNYIFVSNQHFTSQITLNCQPVFAKRRSRERAIGMQIMTMNENGEELNQNETKIKPCSKKGSVRHTNSPANKEKARPSKSSPIIIPSVPPPSAMLSAIKTQGERVALQSRFTAC